MTANNLLDVIGQAQDAYILSAVRTRSHAACAASPRRRVRPGRRILIAAAVVMLLALTACAVKYAGDFFTTYFLQEHGVELTDSQKAFIQDNVQQSIAQPVVTQADEGYALRIRSALTDGKIAYITVDIQAPEDVSLEGGSIRFLENPLLIPQPADGLILAPDGSSPDAMCDYATVDNADGLPNTASVIFTVIPQVADESVMPFDGSIHWTMKAGGFEKSVFQDMAFVTTPLAQGTWEFDLTFQQIDTREVEFISEPVSILTSDWLQNEYTKENQIVSFTLSGLSFQMTLAQPDIDGQEQDIGQVAIVMKDGTQQTLLCLTSYSTTLGAPIVLEDVDYILLANGVKLPMPE